MSYRDGRRSICLSSQSGCPLTCNFCATGRMAFGRNLTESEILDQALHFRRRGPVNHAVFMGMGEPLMNLDAVLAACERLPAIGISTAHTTISTVGWVPGIERLAGDGPRVRLALSLHAAEGDVRSGLMPVNDRYPIAEVIEACLRWREARNRRVYIEYLMLAGVNDDPDQAVVLSEVLKPHEAFKVNLIPFNPTPGEFTGSSPEAIEAFRATLDRPRRPGDGPPHPRTRHPGRLRSARGPGGSLSASARGWRGVVPTSRERQRAGAVHPATGPADASLSRARCARSPAARPGGRRGRSRCPRSRRPPPSRR